MDVPSISIIFPFEEAALLAAVSSELKGNLIDFIPTSSLLEEVNTFPLAASLEDSETTASKLQVELQ